MAKTVFNRSRHLNSFGIPPAAVILIGLVCVPVLPGQSAAPRRINQPVDDRRLVTLSRNTHPLARPQYDRGAAPPELPIERMLLVLRRSPEQEAALAGFLDDLHDASSPDYHKWLTPEEFGARFGPADEDIATVRSWLLSQGFRVEPVSAGRGAIEFSGTAEQVQFAFHTAIHKFRVDGKDHWANQTDPQLPAALAPVVQGIATLHNFHARPQSVVSGSLIPADSVRWQPQTNLSGAGHALSPADYSVIYNMNPLYQSGITGAGVIIAVVGRTNINVQDVQDFRGVFGLPNNPPQVVVNGSDPGIVSQGEEAEAVLDVTWAGAVARNATVKLVVSQSTNATDGADLSELYAINNNIGGILTESFGACEAGVTSAQAALISSLAQQAAAQGITYLVSSGDAGASGCADPNTATSATGPLSVNVLASTPYTLAVGGTEFNDTANPSAYWSPQNGVSFGSALSYIPENVWNESCAMGQTGCAASNIWAGGGGVSTLFTKPAWQTGVSGIPADGKRDVPDVSLTAASHDPYLLCMEGSCHGTAKSFYGVSGTSAATPSFAGTMALVDQKAGRQGQASYVLYRLAAQQQYAECNGSSTALPAGACVFNDVTTGSNSVPGGSGYGSSNPLYQAVVGYDLATGLGSVNAANLVNHWTGTTFTATTTTLSVSPASIAADSTATVNIAVSPKSASGTPAGSVRLATSAGTQVAVFTLVNGAVVSHVSLPAGSYTLTAHYQGDGTYAPSDSAAVSIVVSGPDASLSTNALAFGSQAIGTAGASQSVILSNTGSAVLTGIAIAISGPNAGDFTAAGNCAASLAAGARCSISVTFKPTAAGSREAIVNIRDNAAQSLQAVALTGVGAGSPKANVSVPSLNFGSVHVGASSGYRKIVVSSAGAAPLVISSISLTGTNARDFHGSTNCTTVLAAGASCTISIAFGPIAAGSRVASVVISDNAMPSAQSVGLSGSGVQAAARRY